MKFESGILLSPELAFWLQATLLEFRGKSESLPDEKAPTEAGALSVSG
jgi:hypothetical protein